MNIRKHPNYSAIHCRGVPRGRPVALQRRTTCFNCRSLRWSWRNRSRPCGGYLCDNELSLLKFCNVIANVPQLYATSY